MNQKYLLCLVVMLVILSVFAGCVSPAPNNLITVSSTDLETLTPVNIGTVDVYTTDFRIKNPSNLTFSHVEVTINLVPVTSYCHTQTTTIDIPVLAARENRVERVSVSEFSDLACEYTFTYDVVSDPGTAIPYTGT